MVPTKNDPNQLTTPPAPGSGQPPWGEANAKRGTSKMTQAAVRFVQAFPIGSELTPAQFDQWAHAQGYLRIPMGAEKDSDAWLAHLQRRHQFRYKMNKAATHPRLRDEEGVTPFTLDAMKFDVWRVRAPHDAAIKNRVIQRADTLMTTKRQQVDYLLQSADYKELPAYERMFADAMYEDLENFHAMIALQSEQLDKKFAKLQATLKHALETGTVVPRNHGIKALLAPEVPQADVTESDEADRQSD